MPISSCRSVALTEPSRLCAITTYTSNRSMFPKTVFDKRLIFGLRASASLQSRARGGATFGVPGRL
jgi:hypothetical protein